MTQIKLGDCHAVAMQRLAMTGVFGYAETSFSGSLKNLFCSNLRFDYGFAMTVAFQAA